MHQKVRLAVATGTFVRGERVDGRVRVREDLGAQSLRLGAPRVGRDGVEVFEFPNGQVETHSADGAKDIRFPDGTTKTDRADGSTSTRFPDGVVVEGEA